MTPADERRGRDAARQQAPGQQAPGHASAGAGGPHPPLPPADLATRRLDPLPFPPQRLVRIHWPGRALYFGPDAARPPAGRFDAPNGEYRVHYSGQTFAAAFVEAYLRQSHPAVLAWSDLAARDVSVLETTRPLRVMPMRGPWLQRLGATAAVASGPYGPSREWGRALWRWRGGGGREGEALDGVQYPSRHDDDQRCLALFDRAASALSVVSTESLATRYDDVLSLQRAYRFGLDLDA